MPHTIQTSVKMKNMKEITKKLANTLSPKRYHVLLIFIFTFANIHGEKKDYAKMEARFVLHEGGRGGISFQLKENPLELYEMPDFSAKVVHKIIRNQVIQNSDDVISYANLRRLLIKGRIPNGRGTVIPALKREGDFYLIQYGSEFYWVHKNDFIEVISVGEYYKSKIQRIWLHFDNLEEDIFFKSPGGEIVKTSELRKWKKYLIYEKAIQATVNDFTVLKDRLYLKIKFDYSLEKYKANTPADLKKERTLWFRPFNKEGSANKGWGG